MKKLIQCVALLFLLTTMFSGLAYSANEFFRSVASGNWNANSTWEMSTDGSTWFAATSTPTSTSGAITIRNPNTVTVTASVNADQLVVNSGGTISINSAIILTILDGAGEDLTLNSGGTISGGGTVQTQGAGVVLNINNGSIFSAALKINTGTTSAYDNNYPYTASFQGSITIDAGASLTSPAGGYYIHSNGNVTNNGILTGGGGSTFKMRGATFTNNDTVRSSSLEFDSTTSLAGTGAYTGATIFIAGSGNVSLANNVTFSSSSFYINNGGVLNPNTNTFTLNSGGFTLFSGGTVSNSGTFQTRGSIDLNVKSGSNFNGPLKVNSGISFAYDDGYPYTAIYKGTITIDAGAIFAVKTGGYTIQANNTVTNNGSITGSGSTFTMRGAALSNSGSISAANLNFDSTTLLTDAGTYTSPLITINASGNVSLGNNVTFSPGNTFTINSGGRLNPNFSVFTFTSGTFILTAGATVTGFGAQAGTLQTQGNVNFDFRAGSTFNSSLRVNTGILLAYNSSYPYVATFSGTIIVDAGATLTGQTGGYSTVANNSVTNNGTITGTGGSTFRMKGPSLANNGSITINNFSFDSTTALSGSGTYTGNDISIGALGNVSLSNNLTFSPATSFVVNSGGILNPNTKTFTYNNGTFYINSGGIVSNSGIFQTQGSVSLVIRSGSNFNGPLEVNTGTTTSYDDGSPFTATYKGTITIDAGAVFTTPAGGYTIQSNNILTNNGTISGNLFRMRGATLTNNNLINPNSFSFDSTTSVSGTGTYNGSVITVGSSGNVSLANDLSFSPISSFTVTSGGILNPNTHILTFNSGAFAVNNGGTVVNSGTFRTQNAVSLIIRNGSSFNAPLKVNTGSATAFDDGGPFTAIFNGTITVDPGTLFNTPGGGYTIRANNNVTNNATISGNAFRFFGANFTNNGNITVVTFNFETGTHTLQGTGSWGTNANILSGSTVTLASNHQMQSVVINAGGTFNLSTFKLLLTASNPIANSGTFTTTSSTVEYDGTSAQVISTAGITYNRLRINNAAGTSLSGAVTVNDTLSDVLGHLNLNGFILTISPTGYLTETPGNTVNGTSGYITTTRNLNAPSSLNVGGLGAVLTTTANLGSTEIRRGHAVQNGLMGNTSILRYFDILPTTNTGLNATLDFKYDDSELNGKPEAALMLFRSTDAGATWTARGGTVNTSTNDITLTGIAAFSRWSAGAPSAVAAQIKLLIEGFYNTGTSRLNMRDTVRAYLRNISTPFAIVDSAKSVIDSVTFTGSFLFTNAPSGTYYIQLKHRSFLETWSKTGGEVYTLGGAFSYDFTTDSAKAYGNNMKKTTGNKWEVFEGDPNQYGTVDLSDLILIYNDAQNFLSGYIKTDVNGDSFVDLSDVLIAYNNSSNFVSKITPGPEPGPEAISKTGTNKEQFTKALQSEIQKYISK